jgi:hypothetical protein
VPAGPARAGPPLPLASRAPPLAHGVVPTGGAFGLPDDPHLELIAQRPDRRADRLRSLADDLGRLGTERPDDRPHPRLQDARLLPRDRRLGRAELVRVLELDAGDAGDGRAHDVRRVEPAAEPDLDQRAVDPGLGEQNEGDRGRRIEEARPGFGGAVAQGVDGRADPLDGGDQARFVDLATADAEAFDPALEMRGREGADALAEGAEDRFGEQAGGALALRARDVEDGEGFLGSAERVEQRLDGPQVEARIDVVARPLTVDQAVEVARRLGEGRDGRFRGAPHGNPRDFEIGRLRPCRETREGGQSLDRLLPRSRPSSSTACLRRRSASAPPRGAGRENYWSMYFWRSR